MNAYFYIQLFGFGTPSPRSKEKTPEGEGDLVNNQRKKLIKSEDEWQKNTGFINSGTMCR